MNKVKTHTVQARNTNSKKSLYKIPLALVSAVMLLTSSNLLVNTYKVNKIRNVTPLNLGDVKVKYTKSLSEKYTKILQENDNINIMFDTMYIDERGVDKLIVDAVYEKEDIDYLLDIKTLDEMNEYLNTLEYDPAPQYSSPVVDRSKKINCRGLTLLAMIFIENNYSDQYTYEVITDKKLPHVYLHLLDKKTGEFIKKIDLTVQPQLDL